MRDLGGSGSVEEIFERVLETLKLPEEILSVLHDPEAGNQTEIAYRLGWTRTYLKKFGVLTNSTRGIWSLASPDLTAIDPKLVVKTVRINSKKDKPLKSTPDALPVPDQPDAPEELQTWRSVLYQILTKVVEPPAFERLIQRLLRESGFVQVEVTGRTGDGGIDGKA